MALTDPELQVALEKGVLILPPQILDDTKKVSDMRPIILLILTLSLAWACSVLDLAEVLAEEGFLNHGS